MKLRISTTALIAGFILLAGIQNAQAGDPLAEKKKTYSKSYPLSGSDRVSLSNQFGEMKIIPWDKNEVRVDITIVTRASTDEMAQKIMDRIRIEDGKSGNNVSFTTKMSEMKGNWNDGKKGEYKEQGMQIDYAVYMPTGVTLMAKNQFGPMVVPDYRGSVELESKFGKLTAGRLDNLRALDVEFGSAVVESASGGKITIKFSKADLRNLQGNVVVRAEFCDKLRLGLGNSVKDLDLKTSYSQVYLDVPTNLSASFNIFTSFGEFNNKTNFAIRPEKDDDERYGPKFDKTYSGNAGAGATKYRIRSEFGEITLGHNLQVDMSESKDKKKDKQKGGTVI
jgi:hypothetical protein